MRLAHWSFLGIEMPMIEDDDRQLYCTNKALCEMLEIEERTLRKLYARHRDEFVGSTTKGALIQFLRGHKADFGISYVRDNTILWNEGDMLLVAFLSRSTVSKDFRRGLIEFIKQHATRSYIEPEEYNAIKTRLADVEAAILELQGQGSRRTKPKLRLVVDT